MGFLWFMPPPGLGSPMHFITKKAALEVLIDALTFSHVLHRDLGIRAKTGWTFCLFYTTLPNSWCELSTSFIGYGWETYISSESLFNLNMREHLLEVPRGPSRTSWTATIPSKCQFSLLRFATQNSDLTDWRIFWRVKTHHDGHPNKCQGVHLARRRVLLRTE